MTPPTRNEEQPLCGRCCEREATKVLPVPGAMPYVRTEFHRTITQTATAQRMYYCETCADIRAEEVQEAREWRSFQRAYFHYWCRRNPDLAAIRFYRKQIRKIAFRWKPRPLLTVPDAGMATGENRMFWRAINNADKWRKETVGNRIYRLGIVRRNIANARRHRIAAALGKD